MTNIVSIWANYVSDLLRKVHKEGSNKYGTKKWYRMDSLKMGKDGAEDHGGKSRGKILLEERV